jgi:transcriptional regulator with XRE-family HTH domain
MRTRIQEFLKIENKSSAQFAEEIGVQPSSISHIISGRNNPSLDFVTKMLTRYPTLSGDWLLFGRGQMYRDPQLNRLFEITESLPGSNSDTHSRIEPGSNLRQADSPIMGESGIFPELKTGSDLKRAKRIVWFYDDDTFKEYIPGID